MVIGALGLGVVWNKMKFPVVKEAKHIQLKLKYINSPMVLVIPGLFSSPYYINIDYPQLLSSPQMYGKLKSSLSSQDLQAQSVV